MTDAPIPQRLSSQFARVTIPPKKEQTQRKQALRSVIGGGLSPLQEEAITKSAIPVEDFSALEGVSMGQSAGYGQGGVFYPATDHPSLAIMRPGKIDTQPASTSPATLDVAWHDDPNELMRAYVHEIGHAVQFKGLTKKIDSDTPNSDATFALLNEKGEGGTPRSATKMSNDFEDYFDTTRPYMEGGAVGYENRYVPTSVLSKVSENAYDRPGRWRTGIPHGQPTYDISKATAKKTGNPGSIHELNTELMKTVSGAEFAEYPHVSRRMILNHVVRNMNPEIPEELNMMQAPFEIERKRRMEANGHEYVEPKKPTIKGIDY
jgi:hypothetical protein